MKKAAFIQRNLALLWRPCTQVKDHESLLPIPIRGAELAWLEDFEGTRYLDAISFWWPNPPNAPATSDTYPFTR